MPHSLENKDLASLKKCLQLLEETQIGDFVIGISTPMLENWYLISGFNNSKIVESS